MQSIRVYVVLACVLWAASAWAAVTQNAPIFPQTPKHYMQRFITADVAGTYKVIVTGNATGANAGTRCHAVYVTSDDTSVPHLITFRTNSTAAGANPFPGPTVTVGTNQIPVGVLNSTAWPGLAPDSDGGYYIHLEPGQVLEATYATAITAAKIIAIQADCWDF